MLLSFLTIHLMAMGVMAEVFATLAPPFHLSRDRSGRTILVCLVSSPVQGNMVITWLSKRAGKTHHIANSNAKEEDGTSSIVSVISVPTKEWDSYTCFIAYSNPTTIIHRRYIDYLDDELDGSCYEDATNDGNTALGVISPKCSLGSREGLLILHHFVKKCDLERMESERFASCPENFCNRIREAFFMYRSYGKYV